MSMQNGQNMKSFCMSCMFYMDNTDNMATSYRTTSKKPPMAR